jgi:outer membrane protein assembly factor BamB
VALARLRGNLILSVFALLLIGCADKPPAIDPSFTPLFPPVTGNLMTISSATLEDLNGDGVRDIVFGSGYERVQIREGEFVFTPEPDTSGYVIAISGATNQILWQVPNPRYAFTSPRFSDLNRDGTPDVIMGGREGALSAFSGKDGALLWRVSPESIARSSFPYNFFTPALIRDANQDGIADLIAVYGGDDLKKAGAPRDPSFVAVISGRDGAVLHVYPSPDGNEIYSSPVVYERADRTEWLIFGTGGESLGGSAYRVPVAALLDTTFKAKVQPLVSPGQKGVIAPATLIELTGDAEPDIVLSGFDGRLVVLDGATGNMLWQRHDRSEEAYHSVAVVRLAPDHRPGFFLSRGVGVFPNYAGTAHRLLDARDGRVLFEYKDLFYPAGAPLAVDLNGDGFDEPIFFSTRFPGAEGGRIYILETTGNLITHELALNSSSTPVIADVRGKGTLELIMTSWFLQPGADSLTWRDLRWQLHRMDLNAKTPPFMGWAGYMGTRADGKYVPYAPDPR